jgi:hypothetical protein
MKDIVDIIDYAETGTIMNIQENFYIYLYKKIEFTDGRMKRFSK